MFARSPFLSQRPRPAGRAAGSATTFAPVLALAGALLLTGTAAQAAPPTRTPAESRIESHIGAVPLKGHARESRWIADKAVTCIDARDLAGAVIVDARNVDIYTHSGRRWRMRLARSCSQLGYYGNFYYHPARPGQICAGTDRLVGRAGGSCKVQQIYRLEQAPPAAGRAKAKRAPRR